MKIMLGLLVSLALGSPSVAQLDTMKVQSMRKGQETETNILGVSATNARVDDCYMYLVSYEGKVLELTQHSTMFGPDLEVGKEYQVASVKKDAMTVLIQHEHKGKVKIEKDQLEITGEKAQ